MHRFNKYNVSYFNEISSIDSKSDTINKFYKDFLKLKELEIRNKETNQRKIAVLKSAPLLYEELIRIYKKKYNQVLKSKNEDWMQVYDYKNLKDFDYQPDQPQQPDQELPQWIQSKDEFNELKNRI